MPTPSPRIITSGPFDWIVVAEWFGSVRTVHGPASLFDCLRFAGKVR